MGSSVPDICFDGKLNAYKSLLKKTIQIDDGDAKVVKLEWLIRNLEVERTKIEVFHRELPLCAQLLNDVIEWLKEELEGCQKGPVFVELMPMKSKFEEDRELKVQNDAKDKKNWMSSVQLWSHNDEVQKADKNSKISKKRPRESTSAQIMQFQIFSRKEERFEMGANGISVNSDSLNQVVMQSQQRKTRRSWSDELHRRFISALNQLGGPQVATPKQIRELMKVDGLTNDEVKSHLQKYRMHTKRVENNFDKDSWLKPIEQHYSSSQQSTSQSGSPTGPLHFPVYNGGAVSFTAGESCELEEDGRSESYGFFK